MDKQIQRLEINEPIDDYFDDGIDEPERILPDSYGKEYKPDFSKLDNIIHEYSRYTRENG